MKMRYLILSWICLSSFATAVDYKPWVGELLEFEWRNSFLYQNYSSVSSGHHQKKYHANDLFLTSSLCTALPNLTNGNPDYALELEATQASTRRQSGGIDNLRATGRYVLWDDVAGDPVSLTTGMSYIQSFVASLHDVSSFHHGRAEGELFLSAGKETACGQDWIRRWWTVGAVGIADRGSPWLRLNLGYDFRVRERHECRVFCHTLWGLGNRHLHVHDFRGYGAVGHQSVDVGFKYSYLIDCFGSISLQYANRVYARNFPLRANLVTLEWVYTFGLIN